MYDRRCNLMIVPLFLLLIISCQSASEEPIETFTVNRGAFVHSLTETGELKAVNSQTIAAPSISWRFGTLKITKIVEDGKQVEKGDLLVEFDKAEVLKSTDDAKAEFEIAEAEVRKAKASQQSQIEGLEADYEKTRLQHRISELNLEKASFESEIRRKEIELELEKAGISLQRALQEIENQKSVNHEEISKLELKVHQVESKLEEAQETLAKLTITAPNPGIAIIERSWMTRNKYQVDDQLWSGWPLIGLPDLSAMQAIVQINEVDIAKLDTAQTAKIRLDAFPDTSFHGHVSEVATLAHNKEKDSKVKVFDVTILLDENDAKFMPGMTVSCEIIVNEISDTILVPIDALFNKDGDYIVYLMNGGKFELQVVKTGPENDDYVVITEGLTEGDEVSMIDPTAGESKTVSAKIKKTGSGS